MFEHSFRDLNQQQPQMMIIGASAKASVSRTAVNLQPPTWSAGRAHLKELNKQLLGRQTIAAVA